jgi:hypothetical protein
VKSVIRSSRLSASVQLQRCDWPACGAACCYGGAWVDEAEAVDIRRHSALILPHMPEGAQDPRDWFDDRREPDSHSLTGLVTHTRVVEAPGHYMGTACAFLRPDHKCALQLAGVAAGLGPWRFKPFYCILHPLDLDVHGRITLDDEAALAAESGSCLRPSTAPARIADLFAEELAHLTGPPNPE